MYVNQQTNRTAKANDGLGGVSGFPDPYAVCFESVPDDTWEYYINMPISSHDSQYSKEVPILSDVQPDAEYY